MRFFRQAFTLAYFTSQQTVLLVCWSSCCKFLLSFLRTLGYWIVNEFRTPLFLLIFLSRVPLQLQTETHEPLSTCPVRLGLYFLAESFFDLLSYSTDTSKPPARAKIRLKYSHGLHFITGTYDKRLGGPLEKSLKSYIVLHIVVAVVTFGVAEFSGVIQNYIYDQSGTVLELLMVNNYKGSIG